MYKNNKTILCLIDDLGSGGAERQMAGLASMLKGKGYLVEVIYFESKDFFVQQLENNGVAVKYIPASQGKIKLMGAIRREIKAFTPEVVISYLQSSCIIASILKLLGLRYKLIVSERNTNLNKTIRDTFRFNIFRVADCIVSNSYSQQKFINEYFPFLKKNMVIVNFVDTEHFHPVNRERGNTIVIVATLWKSKNALGFIKAMKILKNQGINFHVKWFGKVKDQDAYLQECKNLIERLQLQFEVELLDKTQQISEEYCKADYFCLPSFYEGTPNVICEALASGLPIVCSNVCDNNRYVKDGENGYLFDPKSPEDIASVVKKMLTISDIKYHSFKTESRRKAVENFSKSRFIDNYISLINNI